MFEEEDLDFPPFPDLLGAVMQLSEEVIDDVVLDDDGTFERPLLPLRGMVLFPQMVTPLFVGRESSLAAIQAAAQHGESLIAAAQRDGESLHPGASDIYLIGTHARVGKTLRLPDNSLSVLCQGQGRVEIVAFTQWEPYIRVRVRPIYQPNDWNEQTEALMRATLDMFEKVVEMSRRIPDDAFAFALNAENAGFLADFITTTLDLPLKAKQSLLETLDPVERLRTISVLLGREVDLLETETMIHHKVQQEIDKSQREHFLREQMRVIQGELGEGDIFTQELAELKETIANIELPEPVQAKADKELARLASMPPMSPEMGVIRNYLDWLVDIPWDKMSEDNLDVRHAAKVLNADHYGLEKIKDRILEYIAVKAIAADKMKTPILCFVGPPGVGKTSLGKSIARALNRQFVRMSLGGMRDEAEIRGHRRTYIGAMPGRIVQSLRRVGTNNPLFMLDEIDKIGKDFRGDPSSALLEVLDPEQNYAFRDHYLDLDLDLSNVMFVTTANNLRPIPPPLRDRMEIIDFSSYLDNEKIEICRRFIIPRQLEQHGLDDKGIQISEATLKMLIRQYTYEAGVRNLEREIGSVCRKLARKLAEGKRFPKKIGRKQLEDLLGAPKFSEDMLHEEDEVGLAMGVAWTANGGDTMPIEVNLMPGGKGNLQLTGKLGDVLKESARLALTYTRSRCKELGIEPERFDTTDIHIHMPEGAVPKDGPSAGVPLTIALISAFTNRPISRTVGMTGEITLRGRVLPVGGIREKALAAGRVGIKTFVMPKKNHSDLQEIPKNLRQQLNFVEVSRIEDVIDVALLPEF